MEEKQVILSVEHLMISFSQYVGGWRQRKLPVIRDLNIKVREHEVVAVAGSSGCPCGHGSSAAECRLSGDGFL